MANSDPIENVTRADIETALDRGNLWAKMGNGNWWKLRRNGSTKLWKTRPTEFRIPIKAGLKATGSLDHSDAQTGFPDRFLIANSDPNPQKRR